MLKKTIPTSYTVIVSFTNRPDMAYTTPDKEDAKRFKSFYKSGSRLTLSGSIVKQARITLNY